MNPPAEIVVAPYTFQVVADLEACIAADASGACLDDVGKIIYNPALKDMARRDTVLHESMHAIWGQTNLRSKYDDIANGGAGEVIIRVLAPRLLALLRDNPQLVKFLTAS